MSVSLLTMRTRAQQRAGMENSTQASTSEWNEWINQGLSELYDRMIGLYGHEPWEASTAILVKANQAYDSLGIAAVATSTWLKILSVHLVLPNGGQCSIPAFEQVDRDRKTWGGYIRRRDPIRYRWSGVVLEFEPDGKANGYTGTVRYIPHFTDLSADADIVPVAMGNRWCAYAQVYAANIARSCKLRLDCSDLNSELRRLEKEIDEAAMHRNAGAAPRVVRRARW